MLSKEFINGKCGHFCKSLLPLEFDNTLTVLEKLCRFSCKLNELIEAVNTQNLTITDFTNIVITEINNFESSVQEIYNGFENRIELLETWRAEAVTILGDYPKMKADILKNTAGISALNVSLENVENTITTQGNSIENIEIELENAVNEITIAKELVNSSVNLVTETLQNLREISADTLDYETGTHDFESILDLLNTEDSERIKSVKDAIDWLDITASSQSKQITHIIDDVEMIENSAIIGQRTVTIARGIFTIEEIVNLISGEIGSTISKGANVNAATLKNFITCPEGYRVGNIEYSVNGFLSPFILEINCTSLTSANKNIIKGLTFFPVLGDRAIGEYDEAPLSTTVSFGAVARYDETITALSPSSDIYGNAFYTFELKATYDIIKP